MRKLLFIRESDEVEIKSTFYNEKSIIKNVDEAIDVKEYDAIYFYKLSEVNRKKYFEQCNYAGIPFYSTLDLWDGQMVSKKVTKDGDNPVIYNNGKVMNGYQRFMKRLGDIVFSLVMLVLLSPLFLITSLLVVWGKGGIFYKQKRITLGGKIFNIYKFRTMKKGSEQLTGATLYSEDNDGVTRIGRILRKTKIDELPQLFNILKGDMSLVGPRPERPEIETEIIKELPQFQFRTKVKAGLTGYAQINGGYYTDFAEKLKWDMLYINNFSLLFDIKILLKTIPSILKK